MEKTNISETRQQQLAFDFHFPHLIPPRQRRDDIGDAFPEFFEDATDYICEGVKHKGAGKWLGLGRPVDVKFYVK